MEEEFKRESAYNFPHNYPEFFFYIPKHVESGDNIFIDQVEYLSQYISDSYDPLSICAILLALYIYIKLGRKAP